MKWVEEKKIEKKERMKKKCIRDKKDKNIVYKGKRVMKMEIDEKKKEDVKNWMWKENENENEINWKGKEIKRIM